MEGKYLFVWLFAQVEYGRTIDQIADDALEMDVRMVAVKIADGAAVNGASTTADRMRLYVDAFHKRGIQVWGWQYLYGGRKVVRDSAGNVIGFTENTYSTPQSEAQIAIDQLARFGLDGYIMDPEREYKTAPAGRASEFMGRLRAGIGALPVGLCSYRYPRVHPELAWREFLAETDYHMPQVYWGHGPSMNGMTSDGRWCSQVELDTSVEQLRALKDIPFMPVGRAYIGDGHAGPRPEEITAFLDRARALEFVSAGFWAWDFLRPSYPGASDRKAAISDFSWSTTPPPPPPPPPPPSPILATMTVITALNVRTSPDMSSNANIVGTMPAGTVVNVLEFLMAGGYLWARHSAGWSARYQIGREYMK